MKRFQNEHWCWARVATVALAASVGLWGCDGGGDGAGAGGGSGADAAAGGGSGGGVSGGGGSVGGAGGEAAGGAGGEAAGGAGGEAAGGAGGEAVGGAGGAAAGGAGGAGGEAAGGAGGEAAGGADGEAAGGAGGAGGEAAGGAGGEAAGGAGGEASGGAGGEAAGGAGGEMGMGGAGGEMGMGGAGGEPGMGGAGGEMVEMDAGLPEPDAEVMEPDAEVMEPDAEVEGHWDPCGPEEMIVGEYATWCGKVNVHRDWDGDWVGDDDCSSGCNINGAPYCQAFWPEATRAQGVPVSPEEKPFETGGCREVTPGPGTGQAACCAPNPCPEGTRPAGEYARWCGKVNLHRDWDGDWVADPDCSSGCNVGGLNYCQRFWPDSTEVVGIEVTPEEKPFETGGCRAVTPGPGTSQAVCCVPY